MPRMRTIKPSFFTDDELGELQPLARLLYAGLWCHADRKGRLEDRPKRLKVEVLPYDECDVDALLAELAAHGFILRYEVAGARYIAIPTFGKHQNPHIKEQASTIPDPPEHRACLPINSGQHQASTMHAPEEHHASPAGMDYRYGNESEYSAPYGAGAPAAPDAAPSWQEALFAAFETQGLTPPTLEKSEGANAKQLLKYGTAEELAACWQEIAAGEWGDGDGWLQRNLSFTALVKYQRFRNWLESKNGRRAPPKGSNGRARRISGVEASLLWRSPEERAAERAERAEREGLAAKTNRTHHLLTGGAA